MRILWVHQEAIPPSLAGPTRSFSLTRELVRRGHQVSILASSFDRFTRQEIREDRGAVLREETIDGVRFLWMRTPPYKGNDWARMRNLIAFAWGTVWCRRQPLLGALDLVVGSSPYPFAAFAAGRLASALGVPFALEVRDLWPETLIALGRYGRRHPVTLLLACIERQLYRKARVVLTPLDGIEAHVRKQGGTEAVVHWIPNGVDMEFFPAPSVPRPGPPFTVMYAGALNEGNDLETLLRAASHLQTEVSRGFLRFKFLGDGPNRLSLERRTRDGQLEGIEFRPSVPKSDFWRELAEAHFLWAAVRNLPLYRHGLALNKFFDYMAAARPLLFAGPGFAKNPIEACRCGSRVPAEDSQSLATELLRFTTLSDKERHEMGLRGRNFVVAHHDLSKISNNLEAALMNMLSAGDR